MAEHLQHSSRALARLREVGRELVHRTIQGIAEPWAQVSLIHEAALDGVLLVHQLASALGREQVGVDVELDQHVNPRWAIPTVPGLALDVRIQERLEVVSGPSFQVIKQHVVGNWCFCTVALCVDVVHDCVGE
eukprot:10361656-Alexandrium_andersonii.AAC.1